MAAMAISSIEDFFRLLESPRAQVASEMKQLIYEQFSEGDKGTPPALFIFS